MLEIKNIVITSEILKLIAEIDEFKGRWQVIENLAPERLSTLKRIATIESVGSSTRIEGSKLTDTEVENLLSRLETTSFTTRDEQEVAGYIDAMETIFDSYDSLTVTENHIKQLHGILLKYSSKDDDHRGNYKKTNNSVEAFGPDGKSVGIVFQTATPFETPLMMKDLVEWYNNCIAEEQQHPLCKRPAKRRLDFERWFFAGSSGEQDFGRRRLFLKRLPVVGQELVDPRVRMR